MGTQENADAAEAAARARFFAGRATIEWCWGTTTGSLESSDCGEAAEAAALSSFLALRHTFLPCWGSGIVGPMVTQPRRSHRPRGARRLKP